MFTVVISEKRHIDCVKENAVILGPILDRNHLSFCEWDPDADSFGEMLPGLEKLLENKESWRALVINSEEGIQQKNPFDYVQAAMDSGGDGGSEERTEHLMRAYDAATKNPLTRLATFLCNEPISYEGTKDDLGPENSDIRAYYEIARLKSAKRKAMLGAWEKSIPAPEEFICVAMRTHSAPVETITTAWEEHLEHQYSDFCDRNMYFDRMRFLVFDMHPETNLLYRLEYLRFLYSVILIAGNSIPRGCLKAQRVYKLESENDESELKRIIISYDEKLKKTGEMIQLEADDLEDKSKGEIKDQEVASLYCRKSSIPVSMDREFDEAALFIKASKLGLAKDCPNNEAAWLYDAHQNTRTQFLRFLKLPFRAVRKGVAQLKEMGHVDTALVKRLNEYQVEDVRSFAQEAEYDLVSVPFNKLSNTKNIEERLSKKWEEVETAMESRMSKELTIGLGALLIFLMLLSFAPLLTDNFGSIGTRGMAGIFIAIFMACFLVVQLFSLLFFRYRLKSVIGRLNASIKEIVNEFHTAMELCSRYLTCACSVMRGMSALNYYNEKEDKGVLDARVRRKHVNDIKFLREDLGMTFGIYLAERNGIDERLTNPYLYDYSNTAEYPYPLPLLKSDERTIEFMQSGNSITIPFAFVKYITVTLEELYD